jgi:transposase-like protein
VILAALAVWEDGSYEILHYEIATAAGAGEWVTFLGHLIERGLEAEAVEIVVSDGCLGLPKAMNRRYPKPNNKVA